MTSIRRCLVGCALMIATGVATLGILQIILSLREAGHMLPIKDVWNVLLYRDLMNTASRCAMLSFGIAGTLYGSALCFAALHQTLPRIWRSWVVGQVVFGSTFIALGIRLGSLYPGP